MKPKCTCYCMWCSERNQHEMCGFDCKLPPKEPHIIAGLNHQSGDVNSFCTHPKSTQGDINAPCGICYPPRNAHRTGDLGRIKASAIFEGPNSSLRKTYDEAVSPVKEPLKEMIDCECKCEDCFAYIHCGNTKCGISPVKEPVEGWEKRLQEENPWLYKVSDPDCGKYYQRITKLIRSLLSQTRKETIEAIGKIIAENTNNGNIEMSFNDFITKLKSL